VACHLIDVVDLDREFSLFDFQQRFYQVFDELRAREIMPVLAGGSGLYLESVLLGYDLVKAPRDDALRAGLAGLSMKQLESRLRALQGRLHNTTDLTSRERLVRAIEIAECARRNPAPAAPAIRPLVLGIRVPRQELRHRIRTRLVERMEQGLVEEVEGLRARGVSWERLDALGLEYRYVAMRLRGEIDNHNDLVQKLHAAICRFAKRQESWFGRMERRGVQIHWLQGADCGQAWELIRCRGLAT
jgi:tRNA dimethylallyltransferase